MTVASHRIGYGHLKRCLSLAAHARAAGASVDFLLFADRQAQERVEEAGYACRLNPISDLERATVATDVPLPADAVVTDLVHPGFFVQTQSPLMLFEQLRPLGRVAVAIDNLGEQSLMARTPEADIDLVVIPYVTPEPKIRSDDWRLLSGPQYALLAPEYVDLPARKVRPWADRILVTCGGSDPTGYTSAVLSGLEPLEERLHLRVIVGPLFGEPLKIEVERLAAASRHRVELVSAPESLLDEMLWCDLAIAASGLTKYELAASGTPTLLFSIDAFHDEINRPFAAIGSVLDLGAKPSPDLVGQEAGKLLGDADRRAAMAAIGQKTVDARGPSRLFAEIGKELSCQRTH